MDLQKFEERTMTLKEITDLLEVRHNNAMVVVSKMTEDAEFGHAAKIQYRTSQGNEYETYQLNKRQSIAVAAKLNTSLLMRIIDRWQELESQNSRPLTQMEIVLAHAQRLVDMEREQNQMKAQITALVDGENFLTIVGYCNLTNRRLDQKETSRIGKLASKLCRLQGINTGRARHPVYGEVNSYPFEILAEVFGD